MHRCIHAFVLLCAIGVATPAFGKNLYRCERDGVAQYQDTPCGVDASVRRVDASSSAYQAPSSPGTTSPPTGGWEQQERDALRERHGQQTSRVLPPPSPASRRDPVAEEPASFRCTAADGRVFYRHGACPAELEGPLQTVVRSDFPYGQYGSPTYYTDYEPTRTPVNSEPVSRSEACAEINRPSAGGRRGSDEDAKVDTYDKNLGRDPCAR